MLRGINLNLLPSLKYIASLVRSARVLTPR